MSAPDHVVTGRRRPAEAVPVDDPPTRADHARRLVVASGVALVALAISSVAPLASPLILALALGVAAANTPGMARFVVGTSPRLDKSLLRAGVALLGLRVVVEDVLRLGVPGLVVVAATVVCTYAATQLTGRALGLDRELTTLVAAGFSICGAAAVAAVEASIRARPKDVALAVALVTVFGTAMIGLVPGLAHLLGLSDEQAAVWAGASVHEVAQVVAAASVISGGAGVVAVATTVKLARVLLLAPVQVVSARVCRQHGGRTGPLVPLFLVGFLVAVAVRSVGVLPQTSLDAAAQLTTFLLSAAMFGLGTDIVARQLWPVPARVLALAGVSTGVAAGLSLGLVVLLI